MPAETTPAPHQVGKVKATGKSLQQDDLIGKID